MNEDERGKNNNFSFLVCYRSIMFRSFRAIETKRHLQLSFFPLSAIGLCFFFIRRNGLFNFNCLPSHKCYNFLLPFGSLASHIFNVDYHLE